MTYDVYSIVISWENEDQDTEEMVKCSYTSRDEARKFIDAMYKSVLENRHINEVKRLGDEWFRYCSDDFRGYHVCYDVEIQEQTIEIKDKFDDSDIEYIPGDRSMR